MKNAISIISPQNNRPSSDELKAMIKITHDKLKVDNAFFHAWGVFSNFVPNCWPINEALGGVSKLKEAVEAQSEYVPAYAVGEIKQAVKEALENADEDDVILAFGSLSYLGKVKEAVEKEQDKRQMY